MKTDKTSVKYVPPYEASEKDWQDFFASEVLSEDACGSVDQNDEWLRVAGEYGGFALR